MMFELRNGTVKLGDWTVFQDLNLKVEAGEIVSILGPSGCGKTTLLRACCGLEPLVINQDSTFMMVGERTNVTGSKKFAKLILANDYQTALEVALDQVRGGANLLDVNMDEGMLDSEHAMTTFLNLIATEPEVARIPIMIDSSKWSVIQAASRCV